MVAAVALRCWVLAGPMRMLDPDEAVTGLMAERIADGSFYTYFAGQRYMGALEQYLQAPFAALAPGNAFLLRLPQVALAAVACWLVYRVGARMLGEHRAALAAWLFAAGPAFNLVYGVKSRGAYGSSLVAGLLGLLIGLRHRRGHRELQTGASFGVCCGLAAWLSAQAAVLLLPALCWLLGAQWHRRSRAALAGAGGLLLGALPLLIDWTRHGVTTGLGTPPSSTPAQRLGGLLSPVLPEFLGMSWRSDDPVVPRPLGASVGCALLAFWTLAAFRRRRGLLALVGGTAERNPADLLLVAVPIGGLLYVASSYSWYTTEPRYLFAMYPLLALGLAALLPSGGSRGRAAGAIAVAFVAALSVGTLATRAGSDYRDQLARAAAFLHAAGQPDIYSDYQLAYPLDYYQETLVTAVPYGSNAARFPELHRRVAGAPRPAYAVLDVDAGTVAGALDAAGVHYRRTSFGRVVTFSHLQPARTPGQLGLRQ